MKFSIELIHFIIPVEIERVDSNGKSTKGWMAGLNYGNEEAGGGGAALEDGTTT